MMGPMILIKMMRMMRWRVLAVLMLAWSEITGVEGLTSGSKMIVNNMYRRRGASLLNTNNDIALEDQTLQYTRQARQSGTDTARSVRKSGTDRSTRQSGTDRQSFHLSPALRLLLSRRQQWSHQSNEPQTDSSETVTVKQLPISAPRASRIAKTKQLATPHAKQLATPLSFPSGLDAFSFKEVARRQRMPQVHTFSLEPEEDAEILRGRFVEQPRASALLAPVQAVLPEPIAAVPNRPVGFQRQQDVFQRPTEVFQRPPEVFQRPPEVFQRPPEVFQRPNLQAFPAVPAVPTVTPTTFNRQRVTPTGTPFVQPGADQTFTIGTRQPFRTVPEAAPTTSQFKLPQRDQDQVFEVRQPTTAGRQQSTSRQRQLLTSTSRNPFLTSRQPQSSPSSRPLVDVSPIAGQPSARPRLTAPRTSPTTFLPRSTPSTSSQRTFASRFSPSTFSTTEEEPRTPSASPAPTTTRARQPLPTRPQSLPQVSPSVLASRTERPRSRITTKRPALTVTHIDATPTPTIGFVEDIDPCEDGNYQVIAGQPHRSFNHHLSVGTEPPICDRLLPTGWYRFESPAGSLLPTECPGGNYCGTQIPVWMKGTIPHVSEGVVRSTACINEDRECCVAELPLLVRNCSSWVAYHLQPTPGCNMGYCVGEGVPCPTGLASSNGYTPCDFPVKMRDVVLLQGTNQQQSEILMYCNPLLTDVIVPSTIEIEILWFVDGNNIFSETFNTQEQTVGTLREEYWKMGQTIHCSAQAKHSVVGARTKRVDSNKLFAGLKVVSSSPLVVQEGGGPAHISLTSTVPVLCAAKDRAKGDCCISLEIAMTALEKPQTCPAGNIVDRAGLPNCLHKICRDNWNSTHHIPVYAIEDHLHNGDQLLGVDIRTGFTSSNQWRNYVLKPHKVKVLPSTVQEVCESDSSVFTFDSLRYLHKQQGTYILYRHRNLPQEVQVYYRRCNLRELCHCAVAIRDGDVLVTLDICSRGYLQVWGLTRRGVLLTEDQLPQGLRFLSLNEGRAYEFYFPSGTYVTLGPYLSYIKVFASGKDLGATEGLCGTFDRNQANEFTSIDNNVLCSNTPFVECLEFTKSWLLRPRETLFAGFFRPITNETASAERERICACKHTEATHSKAAKLNEITNNRFFKAGSLGFKGQLQCESRECDDNRAISVLQEVLATVEDRDFERFTDVEELQLEGADSQVATVTVVGGPEQPRPAEGWTITTADAFCGDFIRSSVAVTKCVNMPGVDVHTAVKNCRNDVLYAGDTRYALLHLDRIKEDCRSSVTKNVSLWEVEPGSKIPLPPPNIVNSLCLNDCSHNGLCNLGVCLCSLGWVGADCSIDLQSGPRVTSFSNNGLCDARTKPCKNLSVLGDNFANNEALTCHFEIFKIRGVASKQLVQDDVMSSSATFVSFQQVICHLPNLDIHKNKEIHRFDLRDNTDQTRMFVKVSIAYGNGPPSAPLDLLLYDSQCWHCSIEGQCNANANDQCVFSAANSRVQTFRIGKSITTGEDSEEYLFCTLPHDSGSCDRKEFRYYYNSLERRCKLFVYGGCKGNQNNFLSETACVRRCGDADAIAALSNIEQVPQIEEIDQCRQVKDEGICPGNVPRFYFDDHAQRCLLFSYGGCGGNTNNFITEDECISTCGGPTGALAHAIGAHNGGLKPRKEICNLPINRGGCQAKLTRLFFDTDSGTCKLFVFGGCQGNENNFETMEDCLINCGGPVLAHKSFNRKPLHVSSTSTRKPLFSSRQSTAASSVFLESTTALISTAASDDNNVVFSPNSLFTTQRKGISSTKATEVSFTSISLPNISPCGLPKQVGSCLSFSMRYYYDKEEKLCKKFRYSGCGGNGNNFQTGDNCVKNCGGKIGEVINENKNINERIVLPTMKRTTSTTSPPPTIASPNKHQDSKKRKMKRVRISARGRSRSRSEEAGDSVASSSNVSVVRTRTSPRSRSESGRSRSRARSRVRSRTSSSSSLVSSSTEQSVSLRLAELDLPRFRRPSRTISDYAVQALRREDGERIKGPRVDTTITREDGGRIKGTRVDTASRNHLANVTRILRNHESNITRISKNPDANITRNLIRNHDINVTRASRNNEAIVTRTFDSSRVAISSKPDNSTSKRVVGVATITRVSSPSRGRVTRNHTRHQTENSPENHIGGRRHRERVDEVMKSPPNMKGGLVVIRSYCRYPPLGVDEEVGCDDPTQLFFYNVSSAACEPFVGGMCKRSRNKFLTQQACVNSCVVDSQGLDVDDH